MNFEVIYPGLASLLVLCLSCMALGRLLMCLVSLVCLSQNLLMAPVGCTTAMEIMNESPWLNAGSPP